jgi:hypothetical protein
MIVDRINKWYDKVREPYRYLIFIGIIISLVSLTNYGMNHGNMILGLSGFALTGIIGLSRFYHIRRDKK